MRDSLGSNGEHGVRPHLANSHHRGLPLVFTRTEQVLIAIELLLVVYSFRLYSLMTSALRVRHSDIWQQLGSPSLLGGNSASATSKVTGYVFSGRYRELRDDEVSTLARRWKAVNLLFICGIAGLAYQTLRYGP